MTISVCHAPLWRAAGALFKGPTGRHPYAMARIAFTRHLETVGPSELAAYDGATVGQVLDAVAADYPRLKSYVLDDHGRVRKHIAIFVDGEMRPRGTALDLAVGEQSEVYIFQALSGG
jgi:molybdopterin synthase sulfur carrier subunit